MWTAAWQPASATLVAGGARWFWRQPVLELALRTSRGQRIAHPLPDGSRLDLAARTAVEVAYFRDRREVRLAGGEAISLRVKDLQYAGGEERGA